MSVHQSKAYQWQFSLAGVLLILGLLLSLQFKTQQEIVNSLEMQDPSDLVAVWKNLNQKKATLEQEVAELARQQEALNRESEQGQVTLKELLAERDKLQLATGVVPARGPGITVTFTQEASLLYLDLIDLVNELWVSGAEAVAINEHRVTLHTAIADGQDEQDVYITVNGQRLLYPIVVQAIGDPATLEKGLTFTGGLIDNLETLYGIHPQIRQEKELTLPPAASPVRRYAHPVQPAPPAGSPGR